MKFDPTINLGSVLSGIIGAAGTIVVAWFALAGDVRDLKNKDVSHDASISRLEAGQDRLRQDTKEQIRDIAADMRDQIRDISTDVKQVRGILMDNSAGSRPDMRRWSK
ncbi:MULTISPECIES: hypothetical protein [unclassified Cupriavidus]|uniref:hypothetical protein n=1 Tax=unclassified Cupriavidus TaxID=2640874 RepID=UPI001BFFE358|nr:MULTISPECIES: hypothetical protein [unclassified Cupriavidus]MCA3182746.1 hypothetical protein [Cupriavidus sp.]MCA3189808.1 hypothetical protein [Cupriavidus sp.]MCA3196402.1 hypothetical protein [Cupriavidus sp.]MCA3202147.1 hypothetical protein [Cupriavidus sp.]MCA3231926.1 hypothetical protein [Cupriavidus sp.]